MKDGSTHMAHKAEHAVDLSSGALLAVTLQGADQGDTTTIHQSLAEAGEAVAELIEHEAVTTPTEEPKVSLGGVEEVVADKGYHSGAVLQDLATAGCRSYIPEPDRGRRNWDGKEEERKRVYANRRRVRRERGKRLQRQRSELTERSMAHMYETGGMRRVHLKGRDNILKRLLVNAGGFNLALAMRKLLGIGKPRRLQGAFASAFASIGRQSVYIWSVARNQFERAADSFLRNRSLAVTCGQAVTPFIQLPLCALSQRLRCRKTAFTTGCYAYAAKFPNEVAKLVLMDAFLPGVDGWEQVYNNPGIWHFRFNGPTPEALVKGRERAYFEHFWNDFAADKTKSIPKANREAYTAAYARPGRMRAGWAYFVSFQQAANDFAVFSRTPLGMPVLAVGGEKANGNVLGKQTKLIGSDVTVVVVKNAGHWLMEEQPRETTAALLKFL